MFDKSIYMIDIDVIWLLSLICLLRRIMKASHVVLLFLLYIDFYVPGDDALIS